MKLLAFIGSFVFFAVLSVPLGIWMVSTRYAAPDEALAFCLIGAAIVSIVVTAVMPSAGGGFGKAVGGCLLILVFALLAPGLAAAGASVSPCLIIIAVPALIMLGILESRKTSDDEKSGCLSWFLFGLLGAAVVGTGSNKPQPPEPEYDKSQNW